MPKGFTLIELLIVIGIIGVLAAVVLVGINPLGQLQKARNAQRKLDLKNMAQAVEAYAVHNNGVYPSTGGAWCAVSSSYWFANCGADWIPGVVASGDIRSLPKDPRQGQSFEPCNDPTVTYYVYISNGTSYKILAYCTPEGNVYSPQDPFWDPVRGIQAWQVSTPDVTNLW